MDKLHPTEDINKFEKRALSASVAAVIAFGGTACSATADRSYDPINPDITCVAIENGARLRSGPVVPGEYDDNNLLLTVDMKDPGKYAIDDVLYVPTPNGAYELPSEDDYNTGNGSWLGLPAADLYNTFLDKGDQKRIKKDQDGIIWVNYQKAWETDAKNCASK